MIFSCEKTLVSPDRYTPVAMGNGSLSSLVDYTGGTFPREYCKGIMSGLWRAGIRYDKPGFPLVPFGYFRHELKSGAELTDWKQTFDLSRAEVVCECMYANGARVSTRIFIPMQQDLLVIQVQVSGDSLNMVYHFAPERTTVTPLNETRLSYRIDSGKGIDGSISFFAVSGETRPQCGETEIRHDMQSSEAVFVLAFDEAAETFGRTNSIESIQSQHRADYAAFFAASKLSTLELPPEVERVARVSEYHLRISSTRWSLPVGIYPSHWQGRYFAFDEFFALEGLLAAGHTDLALRIPRFRKSHLEAAKFRAYHYFGKDNGAARFVWEAVEEPGMEGAPQGFWMDHVFHLPHIGLGAWHCFLADRDMEFLRETAYPLLFSCAEYFRIYLVDEKTPGKYVIGKCTDLERLGAAKENAFMTTCGAIALFQAAAKAAEQLSCDGEKRAVWRMLADKLRETLPQNEKMYLPYPNCPDKSIAVLSGLYPYAVLSADDPKQRESIADFINNGRAFGNMYPTGNSICTWYAGWIALAAFRAGMKDEAKRVVLEMVRDTGTFSEVYEIRETGHHPWFTTGEGILLQAICEIYDDESKSRKGDHSN